MDPTRQELLAHLESLYPDLSGTGEAAHLEDACPDGCGCRFDIEEAAFWAATHCHGGQNSNLYAAYCASPYDPGMTMDLPNDEESPTASDLYRDAVEWITGKPYDEEAKA
jgi:hypothetical protein